MCKVCIKLTEKEIELFRNYKNSGMSLKKFAEFNALNLEKLKRIRRKVKRKTENDEIKNLIIDSNYVRKDLSSTNSNETESTNDVGIERFIEPRTEQNKSINKFFDLYLNNERVTKNANNKCAKVTIPLETFIKLIGGIISYD